MPRCILEHFQTSFFSMETPSNAILVQENRLKRQILLGAAYQFAMLAVLLVLFAYNLLFAVCIRQPQLWLALAFVALGLLTKATIELPRLYRIAIGRPCDAYYKTLKGSRFLSWLFAQDLRIYGADCLCLDNRFGEAKTIYEEARRKERRIIESLTVRAKLDCFSPESARKSFLGNCGTTATTIGAAAVVATVPLIGIALLDFSALSAACAGDAKLATSLYCAFEVPKERSFFVPKVAASLEAMASLALSNRDFAWSRQLYSTLEQTRIKEYGAVHDYVAMLLSDIADMEHQAGNTQAAESIYMRSISISQQTHPIEGFGKALTGLANLLRDERRFTEAEIVYKEALKMRRMKLRPEDPRIAQTESEYAKLLRMMKDRKPDPSTTQVRGT